MRREREEQQNRAKTTDNDVIHCADLTQLVARPCFSLMNSKQEKVGGNRPVKDNNANLCVRPRLSITLTSPHRTALRTTN